MDLQVFRRDSRKLPIGDPDVDWEETIYLNLIVHHLSYKITLAVYSRTSHKDIQVEEILYILKRIPFAKLYCFCPRCYGVILRRCTPPRRVGKWTARGRRKKSPTHTSVSQSTTLTRFSARYILS